MRIGDWLILLVVILLIIMPFAWRGISRKLRMIALAIGLTVLLTIAIDVLA